MIKFTQVMLVGALLISFAYAEKMTIVDMNTSKKEVGSIEAFVDRLLKLYVAEDKDGILNLGDDKLKKWYSNHSIEKKYEWYQSLDFERKYKIGYKPDDKVPGGLKVTVASYTKGGKGRKKSFFFWVKKIDGEWKETHF